MLLSKRIQKIFLIFILFLIFSCSGLREPRKIELVEVNPSYNQVLLINNMSDNEVWILPINNSAIQAIQAIKILPGSSKEIQFVVKRLAELDQNGNPIPITFTAIINGTNGFIGMDNIDGKLSIQTATGEEWLYLISIGECWFENNPPIEDHIIIIKNEEPMFGIPSIRLC